MSFSKHTFGKAFPTCLPIYLLTLTLLLMTTISVWAQEPQVQPEKVYITGENQPCGSQPWIVNWEVWNVGAMGGEAYAESVLTGQSCVNGKLVDANPMIGTFSGGPNGVATFQICADVNDPNNCVTLLFQFVDGKKILFQGNQSGYVIQNPEAFDGWRITPTETPEPTEAPINCFPQIGGISGLKPGDMLSPSVDFVDEKGSPTGIIGHAWLINGELTPSVVWDGKETTLEVQYTCLNHRGDTKTVIIPAYQAPPTVTPQMAAVPQGQVNPPAAAPPASSAPINIPGMPAGLPPAAAVTGLVVGLAGAGISGGLIIASVLSSTGVRPPAVPKQPPAQSKTTPKTEKKEPEKEKKKGKDLLEAEKEALSRYKETLESLSGHVEDAMEKIGGFEGLSPAAKKKLLDKLEQFKKSLDKVSKIAENITDRLEMISKVREQLRSLANEYQQIQQVHMEALKELEGLPEGTANQVADLTTAIEGFGRAMESGISKIPILSQIDVRQWFDVSGSFREFGKGIRRMTRTVHTSDIEARQALTQNEQTAFGGKADQGVPREIQKIRQQAQDQAKQQQQGGYWQMLKDFTFGKEIDPKYLSHR